MDPELTARLVKQRPSLQEAGTAPRSTAGCDSFRLNLAAETFGECVCGHPKSRHVLTDFPRRHRTDKPTSPVSLTQAPTPAAALQSLPLQPPPPANNDDPTPIPSVGHGAAAEASAPASCPPRPATFCSRCASPIKYDTKFCAECGTAAAAEAKVVPATNRAEAAEAAPPPPCEAAPLPGLTPQSTDLRLLELEVLLEREIDELRAENERLGAPRPPPLPPCLHAWPPIHAFPPPTLAPTTILAPISKHPPRDPPVTRPSRSHRKRAACRARSLGRLVPRDPPRACVFLEQRAPPRPPVY